MRALVARQLGDALIRVLNHSGTARWKRRSSATVFCYHNVVPDALEIVGAEDSLHMHASDFAEQVDWIRQTFTTVPINELIDRLRRDRPVGGLAVMTFDDGYTGVVRHAVPVMRDAGLPFTLFPVVRGATERKPFWWDLVDDADVRRREHNVTSLMGDFDLIAEAGLAPRNVPDDMLPASWEMLRSILGGDCTIGVHGVSHRSLVAIPQSEVVWELTRSRERIMEELGCHADVIAYPYGRTNEHVQSEVARVGFRAGMSTEFGLVRGNTSLLNIARVNVPAGISLPSFACWASGLKLRGA